ncbi:hypothetical protein BK138_08560 [Paenibacillus rhizosphaerae]|uniref:Uncharacterized protein n=1 Tax=Paenibacillus rhizosphaerae TaxID=297318 RepID=A0A1R1F3G4_9BACL|nr:hypothetical protein [Paenibacillus rhizosphaerae]OMF58552.1 hypothetical protein BK138_08560 [Paenibacillus rhizosphaerae]
MKYTNEERETVCVYDHVDNKWDVYTCVQKHLTKLNKIATPYWEEKDGESGRVTAGRWKLNSSQVRFAVERQFTDEQRAAMSERARKRFGS